MNTPATGIAQRRLERRFAISGVRASIGRTHMTARTLPLDTPKTHEARR